MKTLGSFFTLLTAFTFISPSSFADTKLDGFWQMNPSYGILCKFGGKVDAITEKAFFKKYGRMQLHLTDLKSTIYWLTPDDEMVTASYSMTEVISNKKYVIKRPDTTIPDVDLVLLNDNTKLRYATKDYEWNICAGQKFSVVFDYLRLNP